MDREPENTRQEDALLSAILRLGVLHGRPVRAASVVSGVPLTDGRLSPDHLDRALAQAGLAVREARPDLRSLGHADLPVLLWGDDGSVRLLELLIEDTDARRFGVFDAVAGTTDLVCEADLLALHPVGVVGIIRAEGAAVSENTVASAAAFLKRIERGNRPIFIQAALITIALNVVGLALPLFTMNVYDRVLPNFAFETLTALAVGAGLAILFEMILRTVRSSVVDHASTRSDVVQANHLFAHVLGAKLAGSAAPVGLRASMLREFETLREFRSSLTLTTLGDVPFFLLYIGVIALIAGPLALVALACVPFVFGAALLFHRKQVALANAGLGRAASRNAVATEALAGLETLKTLGAEGWAARRWEIAVADQIRTGNAMRFYSGLGINLVNLAQGAATVLVIVVGVHLVARGQISAGALMAAMMLLARAMAPVAQMALLFNRLHGAQAARRAIDGFLQAPQERPEGASFVTPSSLRGQFSLEKVSFAYAPMTPAVLSDLSLSIRVGERVGLVGGIGSGKSTLMKLMMQLHAPTGGSIRLDDVGLSAIDPALLRHSMGYVGQESMLFSGTIRMNLTLHRPLASDADVITACQQAMALDWIARLPRGFDTVIGERGQGLSGGQRQTLLIARALVGKPSILLLDEPSSDLDTHAERMLVQSLRPGLEGRTLILASHRPAMLDLVDRLVVLENGKLFADGEKAKVLAILQVQHERRLAAAQQKGRAA